MEFFRKYKSNIILLSPLIVGLLFFVYSSISALITFNTTEVPEEFEKAAVVVKQYEIREIDRKTNQLKWLLNAERAELDQEQKQGRVHKVKIKVYEFGQDKFTISANYALMNNKSLRFYDGAQLVSSDAQHKLSAEEIHFDDTKTDIEVRGKWQLENMGTSPSVITGKEGYISRNFSAITSKGSASLSQGATNLSADELVIARDKPIVARGNASARLANGSVVNASELLIYESGELRARGAVTVTTAKVVVHAQEMLVEAGADRKPRLAKFKGNPNIVQDGRTIYADSIVYDFSTEQALIEGNVHSK